MMTNEEKLVELLQNVLGTCELNLDDLEPETVRICREAAEFLAEHYNPFWRGGWQGYTLDDDPVDDEQRSYGPRR